MTNHTEDAKALKVAKQLKNADNWKHLARWHGDGYYELHTEDTRDVPVRLFFTKNLLDAAEDILYRQIVNATRFPGVRMVVITPDTHYGYGVPVGCVLVSDHASGGTHTVFMATVESAKRFEGEPLLYFRGKFGWLGLD